MIPMDREVDELAEVYSPQQLQQKYKVTQELMYLLALQKVQSDMKAAQNQLTMSQQQQPGTIKEQMEGQVFQEKLRQVSGTIAQQEAQRRQQPQPQQRMMASGGIVGFAEAGEVESEVTDEQLQRYGLTREQFDALPDAEKTDVLNRVATRGRLTRPIKAVGEAVSGITSGIGAIGSAITGVPQKEKEKEKEKVVGETPQAGAATVTPKVAFPGQSMTGSSVYDSSSTEPSISSAAPPAGAGTATGTGGIASQINKLEDTGTVTEVFDETAPGLRGDILGRAGQSQEDIGIAAMAAGDRAAEVAGRDKKARQFEQMERDQERLYQELQDPDKQQAQMRRNIFAAFGRGGNSFGQLMSNGLNAISKTEAGQDQLKQIALDKKQGVTTKAIEVDLNAAGQINAAIDNAQNQYAADRRQAETTLAGLSSDAFKSIQQNVRNNFDLNNARVQASLDEMKVLAQREATQSAREIKSLGVAQARLADINKLKAKVYEAVMANPIGRMAELRAKKDAGTLSKTEAAEYNSLSDQMHLQITSYFDKAGLNDDAEELARQIDLFTSRTEEQGDVSRRLNQYDS